MRVLHAFLTIALFIQVVSCAGTAGRNIRLRQLEGEPVVLYDEHSFMSTGQEYDLSDLPRRDGRDGRNFVSLSPQAFAWNGEVRASPLHAYHLPSQDYYGGAREDAGPVQHHQQGIHIGEMYRQPSLDQKGEELSSVQHSRSKGKGIAVEEESEEKQIRRARRESMQEQFQHQQSTPWTSHFLSRTTGDKETIRERMDEEEVLEIPVMPKPTVTKMVNNYWVSLGNINLINPRTLAEKISQLRIHQRSFDLDIGRLADAKVAQEMPLPYLETYRWWASHFTHTIAGLRRMFTANSQYGSYMQVDREIFDTFAAVARALLQEPMPEPVVVASQNQQGHHSVSANDDVAFNDNHAEVRTAEGEEPLSYETLKDRADKAWQDFLRTSAGRI